MENNEKEKMQRQAIENLEDEIAGNKKGITIMSIGLVLFLALSGYAWNADGGLLLVVGFLGVFFCIMIICNCITGINTFKKELELVRTNFDYYLSKKELAKVIREGQRKADIRVEAAQHPQCPMCGSLQTRRITTGNRAVSVAAVGLASDKIGKQYECLKCKHKW